MIRLTTNPFPANVLLSALLGLAWLFSLARDGGECRVLVTNADIQTISSANRVLHNSQYH